MSGATNPVNLPVFYYTQDVPFLLVSMSYICIFYNAGLTDVVECPF
jgi:hypothetical protein